MYFTMVYGAYGFTGRLIVEELLRRGHRPILAGRDANQLEAEAFRHGGLETRAFSLDSIDNKLAGCKLVINAAGPFTRTAGPLAQACILAHCNYMDVSNEADALSDVYEMHKPAISAGVCLLPGAGLGTSLSTLLVRELQRRTPDLVSIGIVLAPRTSGAGQATKKSIVEAIAGGFVGWRGGKKSSLPISKSVKRRKLPFGTFTLVPIGIGDGVAVQRSTGFGEVIAYVAMLPPPFVIVPVLAIARWLLGLQTFAARRNRWLEAPSPPATAIGGEPAASLDSYVWVVGKDPIGREYTAWARVGEGYAFTAKVTVAAAETLLEKGATPVGALTVESLLNPNFLNHNDLITVQFK